MAAERALEGRLRVKWQHRYDSRLIFILILAAASIEVGSWLTPSGAARGQLDLRGSNAEADGQWEFYWGKLIRPGDSGAWPAQPDAYASLPGSWTSVRVGGKKLPSVGDATYRLRVSHGQAGRELGISFGKINDAFELYADGVLIAKGGSLSDSGFEARYVPGAAYFTPSQGQTVLTLLVSNRLHGAAGPVDGLLLGTRRAVEAGALRTLIADALGIGGRVLLFLVFLALLAIRRDLFSLALALWSFAQIGRLLFAHNLLILRVFPEMPLDLYTRVFMTAGFVLGLLFFFSFWAFSRHFDLVAAASGGDRREHPLWDKPVTKAVLIGSASVIAVVSTVFFFADLSLSLRLYRFFVPVVAVCFAYPLLLIRDHTRATGENRALLASLMLYVAMTGFEILVQIRVSPQADPRPLFFLSGIPPLAHLSEIRVSRQLLSYLASVWLMVYFLHEAVRLRHYQPQGRPSDEEVKETLKAALVSERETEVMFMAMRGLSYEDIADACSISKNTVKTHLRSAYRKMGVSNRAELAMRIYGRADPPETERESPEQSKITPGGDTRKRLLIRK